MEPLPGRRFIDGCVVFNGSKSVFYSGQVLEGKLNFELTSPLHIFAIDAVYLGAANVEWTEVQVETYNRVRRNKQLKYIGREEYFKYTQRLSQGPTVLEAGSHSIPLSYQIPFNCPSSFEGEKGQVKYSVTVYIIHHDGVTTDKIEAPFDVIDPMNLNTGSPDIKNPLVMEFDQMVGCQLFCVSKPLAVSVRLPAQGVCPGQSVPVAVAVRNSASVEITKILFQITTRERFRSQQPQSEYEPPEEVLAALRRGPVLGGASAEYVFPLDVPAFLAPNMEHCTLIDIGYFFKVKIKLSGCNEDMEDEAEICIGLVPLGETDLKNHPMPEKLPIGPLPDPNNQPPYTPSNTRTFTPSQSYQHDVQICPPGPIPYPVVANVADAPIFGSKNSPAGPFEIGFRAPDVSVNPTLPHPVPGYPYPGLPQGQAPPYSGLPQGQAPPYSSLPQGQGSYPTSQPSAPPPY
ncbi:arrestin domain-containing protein 2 [Bicyclus anynana]|uniref:Arrestin domain-containing protein 2 n=1 Tax=Bicyclus anynana TaxID=110368 RepID=A0A6J1MUN2_BICAN|nr:arrestin domain-containing protein 2 [Bicyclus anynana]